jgi:hypothetical protein
MIILVKLLLDNIVIAPRLYQYMLLTSNIRRSGWLTDLLALERPSRTLRAERAMSA